MRQVLGQILIISGLVLVSYWAVHNYLRNRTLQVPTNSVVTSHSLNAPIWIVIPHRLSLGIKPAQVVNGHWNVWPDSVTYLPTDSTNTVIYAHNTKPLFGDLKKVKVGDKIDIIDKQALTIHYVVSQIAVVDPLQVELLGPTLEPVITVYTCTGFLDSQRLVVRATRM